MQGDSFAANAITVSRLARRRKTTAPEPRAQPGCKHSYPNRHPEPQSSYPIPPPEYPTSYSAERGAGHSIKHDCGWGRRGMRYPLLTRRKLSGWSSNRICRSHAGQARHPEPYANDLSRRPGTLGSQPDRRTGIPEAAVRMRSGSGSPELPAARSIGFLKRTTLSPVRPTSSSRRPTSSRTRPRRPTSSGRPTSPISRSRAGAGTISRPCSTTSR